MLRRVTHRVNTIPMTFFTELENIATKFVRKGCGTITDKETRMWKDCKSQR